MEGNNDKPNNIYSSIEILSLEMALSEINNIYKNVKKKNNFNLNKSNKKEIDNKINNSLKKDYQNKKTSLISIKSLIDSKLEENQLNNNENNNKELEINNENKINNLIKEDNNNIEKEINLKQSFNNLQNIKEESFSNSSHKKEENVEIIIKPYYNDNLFNKSTEFTYDDTIDSPEKKRKLNFYEKSLLRKKIVESKIESLRKKKEINEEKKVSDKPEISQISENLALEKFNHSYVPIYKRASKIQKIHEAKIKLNNEKLNLLYDEMDKERNKIKLSKNQIEDFIQAQFKWKEKIDYKKNSMKIYKEFQIENDINKELNYKIQINKNSEILAKNKIQNYCNENNLRKNKTYDRLYNDYKIKNEKMELLEKKFKPTFKPHITKYKGRNKKLKEKSNSYSIQNSEKKSIKNVNSKNSSLNKSTLKNDVFSFGDDINKNNKIQTIKTRNKNRKSNNSYNIQLSCQDEINQENYIKNKQKDYKKLLKSKSDSNNSTLKTNINSEKNHYSLISNNSNISNTKNLIFASKLKDSTKSINNISQIKKLNNNKSSVSLNFNFNFNEEKITFNNSEIDSMNKSNLDMTTIKKNSISNIIDESENSLINQMSIHYDKNIKNNKSNENLFNNMNNSHFNNLYMINIRDDTSTKPKPYVFVNNGIFSKYLKK